MKKVLLGTLGLLFSVFMIACSAAPGKSNAATASDTNTYYQASAEISSVITSVMGSSGLSFSTVKSDEDKSVLDSIISQSSLTKGLYLATNFTINGYSGTANVSLSADTNFGTSGILLSLTFNDFYYNMSSKGLNGNVSLDVTVTSDTNKYSILEKYVADLTWNGTAITWDLTMSVNEDFLARTYAYSISGTINGRTFNQSASGSF